MLADGTNTYLYGPSTAPGSAQGGRLAQYQASMQYFGADGLGSVRQMYDANGQVVGSSRYDPYGSLMAQSGATSVFAFAGEQQDATGLTYLRARYYSAAQGRFTTRDVWEGDPNAPMSYNAWNYTNGNPVNWTDPTGHDPWWCDAAPDPQKCRRDYYSATTGGQGQSTSTLLAWYPSPGYSDPTQDPNNVPFVFTPPPNDPFLLHTGFPPDTAFTSSWSIISDFFCPVVVGSAAGPYPPVSPAPFPGAGPYQRLPGSDPKVGDAVFRIAGGGSPINGRYWGPTNPNLFADPPNSLGLPTGANSGNILLEGTLLDPNGIIVRPAAPLPPNAGQATEWYFTGRVESQILVNRVTVKLPGRTLVFTRPSPVGARAFWDFLFKLPW